MKLCNCLSYHFLIHLLLYATWFEFLNPYNLILCVVLWANIIKFHITFWLFEWFGLVILFNHISTLMDYQMSNLIFAFLNIYMICQWIVFKQIFWFLNKLLVHETLLVSILHQFCRGRSPYFNNKSDYFWHILWGCCHGNLYV